MIERGFIFLKGHDAFALLQSLLTCDVRVQESGIRSQESGIRNQEDVVLNEAQRSEGSRSFAGAHDDKRVLYGFLLTPNGRFLFDVFIVPFEGGYLLDVYNKEGFIKQLKRYRLNRQVEMQDVKGYVGWSKEKPDAGIYYPEVRFYGYRLLLDSSSSLDEYNYERIKNGISDPPFDLIPEKGIVLEHRLPKDAISYDKGCYIGQEFISRTHYLGVLRKKVLPYQIIKGDVKYGDALQEDLGQVLSVVKDVCLVRVGEEAFDKEALSTLEGALLVPIDL